MMVYWSQVRVFNGFKNIMRRRGRSGLYNYYSLFALKLTCTTIVTKRTIFLNMHHISSKAFYMCSIFQNGVIHNSLIDQE